MHAAILGLSSIRRLIAAIAAFMNVFAGWAYVLAALFITVDVLCRYFLGFSSGATTEVSGYLLGFGISWSLAQTMVERAHIRIDILVMKMPVAVRQYLHFSALVLLLALVSILAWSSVGVVEESMLFQAHDLSGLSIPLVVPQGLWAFGFAVFAVLLIVMTLETAALIVTGNAQEADRLLRPRSYVEETEEALIAVGKAEQHS